MAFHCHLAKIVLIYEGVYEIGVVKLPFMHEKQRNPNMEEHVYKHIELTGSSTTSIEAAVQNAVARAAQTVRHLRWFEVTDTRGVIDGGNITHWQVTIKIGFTLES
jgi:flavin-binding protein dodecin